MTMAELLGEWTGYLPRVLAVLRGDEPLPRGSTPAHDWVIVSDIAAHNQDLRGALDRPDDRESAAVTLGLHGATTCTPSRMWSGGEYLDTDATERPVRVRLGRHVGRLRLVARSAVTRPGGQASRPHCSMRVDKRPASAPRCPQCRR
jgi:hypothetical protein